MTDLQLFYRVVENWRSIGRLRRQGKYGLWGKLFILLMNIHCCTSWLWSRIIEGFDVTFSFIWRIINTFSESIEISSKRSWPSRSLRSAIWHYPDGHMTRYGRSCGSRLSKMAILLFTTIWQWRKHADAAFKRVHTLLVFAYARTGVRNFPWRAWLSTAFGK